MIKKFLYTSLTKLIAWLKRNRVVKPMIQPVKINLGSGLQVYGDWLNIDANFNILISKFPKFILKFFYKSTGAKNWFSEEEFISKLRNHSFIHHRLEYGIPFKNDSVDYIYSSHILEHLYKDKALKLLKESYRVLKSGGLIRIVIPDLEYALSLFYSGKKEEGLEFFFPKSSDDYLSRHQYMYDFDMLKDMLEFIGFCDVKRCVYQQGETPDVEKLDCRPGVSLHVEAKK